MSAARRVTGPVVALLGIALVAWWITALPHRSPTSAVAQAPVVHAEPLVGTAVPAGQQRLEAGETATLAGGSTVGVLGPRVGVPAGSAAKLGDDALIPVAFTIAITAGPAPLTVRPGDFSTQIEGSPTVVGQVFGDLTTGRQGSTQTAEPGVVPATGTSGPATISAGTTQTFTIPFRCTSRPGYVVYAPAGQPLVSWAFVAEDD